MWIKQFIVLVLCFVAIQCETYTFPDGFLIGSASVAWNKDGKGENDHSIKLKEDVKAMKEVGVSVYKGFI